MTQRKTRKKTRLRKNLSDLELSIMNVVWDLQECSSNEVIDRFQKQRRLAPTTIRTVLTNIEKKGYLERVPSVERGYRYRPTVSRQDVANTSLKSLVSNLFKNSPRLALLHLLKDERLDDQDLEEVRKLILASSPKKGKK